MTFGVWEIVFILIIVLIVLGTGRLSELGGAFGKGVREFRKASTDEHPAAPGPAARRRTDRTPRRRRSVLAPIL